MTGSRRDFLKTAGVVTASLVGARSVRGSSTSELDPDRLGVLVDTTLCIGCRKCEWACNDANSLPNQHITFFDDQLVLQEQRRLTDTQFTVVNRYEGKGPEGRPLDVKIQCMHCEQPACVSVCIVGSLEKQPNGPVTYDEWKCIGCRYCMVACPFQVPAYEYGNALTPRVMKCPLCISLLEEGKLPACVEICPKEALTFGQREDLLKYAHEKIRHFPERYVDHLYGEKEVGGTSWLYLSSAPFTDIGFPNLPETSPTKYTESVQHGIFKWFNGPILLFGLLGLLMRLTEKRESHD